MKRAAGILLPVFSLPSKHGIGCFSKEAYSFIDWLSGAGQSYWQILPLCPTSFGDSPYQSFSTFAGNPYFIDPDAFVSKGWLTERECIDANFGLDDFYVKYDKLYQKRFHLLKKAFERSNIADSEEYRCFVSENAGWLDNYSLFMAVKEHFGGASWDTWDDDIRFREEKALERYSSELSDEIEFQRFMQYEFHVQWDALKAFANSRGIKIIGDIPIYVAYDSADVWANRNLFRLNSDGIPTAVAGCPPDGFSETGQLWGNPLYDWDIHRRDGYKWWIERIRASFELYDTVRIDHFRGFDSFYAIPYGAETAVSGNWEKGPGIELFKAVESALGQRDFIAEDLGFITDSVKKLVEDCGFPNMKVLEFAFDSRDTGSRSEYLPHNYASNCVAYTGTHDNQTIMSWFRNISSDEQRTAREYLHDFCTPSYRLNESFIALLMRSCADTVIIPIQDYLGLDDSSRINIPSTIGKNWQWRLESSQLTDRLQQKILKMAQLFSRDK